MDTGNTPITASDLKESFGCSGLLALFSSAVAVALFWGPRLLGGDGYEGWDFAAAMIFIFFSSWMLLATAVFGFFLWWKTGRIQQMSSRVRALILGSLFFAITSTLNYILLRVGLAQGHGWLFLLHCFGNSNAPVSDERAETGLLAWGVLYFTGCAVASLIYAIRGKL